MIRSEFFFHFFFFYIEKNFFFFFFRFFSVIMIKKPTTDFIHFSLSIRLTCRQWSRQNFSSLAIPHFVSAEIIEGRLSRHLSRHVELKIISDSKIWKIETITAYVNLKFLEKNRKNRYIAQIFNHFSNDMVHRRLKTASTTSPSNLSLHRRWTKWFDNDHF